MALDGIVTFTPPVVCENAGFRIRWSMFVACVTALKRIRWTLVMLLGEGVPTKTVCPHAALPGAELTVGRVPLNRYGGD